MVTDLRPNYHEDDFLHYMVQANRIWYHSVDELSLDPEESEFAHAWAGNTMSDFYHRGVEADEALDFHEVFETLPYHARLIPDAQANLKDSERVNAAVVASAATAYAWGMSGAELPELERTTP